jgi:MFS family permease
VAVTGEPPRARAAARRRPLAREAVRAPSPAALLWTLATAALAYSFLQTLVLPALPVFATEFGSSGTATAWVSSSFFLASAVSISLVGRLGDILGKTRVLTWVVWLLALATAAAAVAPSLEALIACRAVQGIGSSIFPLAFGIVRDRLAPERVGWGVGIVSSVVGIGSAAGFAIGGFVLEIADWRWLFVVGCLPALIAALMVPRVPRDHGSSVSGRPDWLGAGLLSLGLAALLLVVSEGHRWGFGSPRTVVLGMLGVGVMAAWVQVERRAGDPIVDLRLIARPPMALLNVCTFLVGYAMFAVFTTLPAFFAADPEAVGFGLGASPAVAGLYFVPSAVTVLVASLSAGAVARPAPIVVLRFGSVTLAVAMAAMAVWHGSVVPMLVCMALTGVGCGTCLAIIARMVLLAVDAEQSAVAGGVNALMRIVGGAVTGQAGAAIVAASSGGDGFAWAMLVAAGAAGAAALATIPLARTLRRGRTPERKILNSSRSAGR